METKRLNIGKLSVSYEFDTTDNMIQGISFTFTSVAGRTYEADYLYDDNIFEDISINHIKHVLDSIIDHKAYVVTDIDVNRTRLKLNYELYGKCFPITIELTVVKDDRKIIPAMMDTLSLITAYTDPNYLVKIFDINKIVQSIPNFYETFHQFMVENCEVYAREVKFDINKSKKELLSNRDLLGTNGVYDLLNCNCKYQFRINVIATENSNLALLTFLSMHGYNLLADTKGKGKFGDFIFVKNLYKLYFTGNRAYKYTVIPKTFEVSDETFCINVPNYYYNVHRITSIHGEKI